MIRQQETITTTDLRMTEVSLPAGLRTKTEIDTTIKRMVVPYQDFKQSMGSCIISLMAVLCVVIAQLQHMKGTMEQELQKAKYNTPNMIKSIEKKYNI